MSMLTTMLTRDGGGGGSGSYKDPAVVATTANLSDTTYDNGTAGVGATITRNANFEALSIDNVTVSTNDRVLVKNQTDAAENGIYVVTNTGSGAAAYVLTRAADFDESDEMVVGALLVVQSGAVNADTAWVLYGCNRWH